MYRFLKVRTSNLTHASASTKLVTMQTSSYLCSFCSFNHSQIIKSATYQQHRYLANVNLRIVSNLLRKRAKLRRNKYVELLEVTNSTAKDKRTAVKNVNASNLSQFVNQNNLVKEKKTPYRQQLYRNIMLAQEVIEKDNLKQKQKKLKQGVEKSKTFSHKPILSEKEKNMKKMLQSVKLFVEKGELSVHLKKKKKEKEVSKVSKRINSMELDIYDPALAIVLKDQNLEVKSEFLTLKEDTIKLLPKQKHREEYLLSYFEVCTECGRMDIAFRTFLSFGKSNNQLQNDFKNILLHNFFLRQFAYRGDLKIVKFLKNLINEMSIKMTPESYAFIFECIARSQDPWKEIDFLKSLKRDMDESKISLNDIVTKPTFINDELEKVLISVKLLENNFKSFFKPMNTGYNCHLLNNVFQNRSPESPAKGLFNLDDLEKKMRQQLKVEIDGQVEIKSVATSEKPCSESLDAREKFQKLKEVWRVEARKAFERNLEVLQLRETGFHSIHLHPYLKVLDKEEYIDIITKEAANLAESSESFSLPISYLSKNLGQQLFKKYVRKIHEKTGFIDKTIDSYKEYCKWYLDGGEIENGRIKWQLLQDELQKKGSAVNIHITEWPYVILRNIGRFLFDIILKDLKISASGKKEQEILVPAFYVVYRHKYNHKKEEIKPHPNLTKLLRDSQPEMITFDATLVPCISPPKPWSCLKHGGYLITESNIIRLPPSTSAQHLKISNISKDQIYPALDCLNQLGAIPWRVNTSILDVAIKVFQDGGSKELNVPQSPSVLGVAPSLTETLSNLERKEVLKARLQLKRRKNEMYSLWCDTLYKLSLANHYRNEIFWLPHNMDFRGRVYPLPPHLSQMGSDFARSMLVFAQQKPLGSKGLDWLKIHIINLTGFKKKESLQSRLEYANEIMDKILDSANNPLTGKMWWTTSDEPWQTLAACMEIAKALKYPDPTDYLTGFPVHQDGSCNGLQHYAALGRDQIGAESVNLCPFEKPHDVYNDVVVLVENFRKRDAENNVKIAQILEGFIQRKVIKQTVMTTVYGVTKFGARLQIMKQLKDIENFPEDKVWSASGYLVEKTFLSLRTMFKSAKEIQDWFTECAKFICTVKGERVEWLTPLGMLVVQPYVKMNTPKQLGDICNKPNSMKQKNAFPPNFIHSLDSTHMMMTSLHCEQAGVAFMSVHDCFWTHPCKVEEMNKICREQFIALHSEPILENLSEFLLKRYSYSKESLNAVKNEKTLALRRELNEVLTCIPAKGTFDLEKIKSSVYFFS